MSKSQQVVIIDGGTFGISAAIESCGRDYEIPPLKARAFPGVVCSGILDRPGYCYKRNQHSFLNE